MKNEYISKNQDETKEIAKEILLNKILDEYKKIKKQEKESKEKRKDKNIVLNIILNGELAAGKTKFTEGVLELFEMGSEISSPTFAIVNEYFDFKKIDSEFFEKNMKYINKEYINRVNKNEEIYLSLNHFDVYRLEDEDEFYDSGLKEYIFPNNIAKLNIKINLIEWGMEIENVFPKPYTIIDFEKIDLNKRKIRVIERE